MFTIIFILKNMDNPQIMFGSKTNYEDICVIDSGTTHAIFKDQKYFSYLLKKKQMFLQFLVI